MSEPLNDKNQKSISLQPRDLLPLHPFRPEAACEEAAVLSVVSEQLQGELCVLDVAVRQQQQVPDASGRRQQAERSQGPPQLSAASYWREALIGGRGAELSGHTGIW